MLDVFAIYSSLWSKAEELGAAVLYDGSLEDAEGWFHPDPNEIHEDAPTISIGRPYYQEPSCEPSRTRNASGRNQPPPDLLAELVTLAHEFGHFVSWKERTPRDEWRLYYEAARARGHAWSQVTAQDDVQKFNELRRAAAQASLTADQIDRILAEEELAWVIGREILEELGFTEFDYYVQRVRSGLHFHRYRLGVDELWVDDARL